jgi:penicillin amidase
MSLSRLLLRLALGRRLPITSGEVRVRGPRDPVTIRRDQYGVPHIDANSEADAVFALGFCQGQDRAGQLEFLWRVARGRLAEWVGSEGLNADRLSRRIGFRRAAEKQLSVQDERLREQLTAFAAGVSAGTTVGLKQKPHEFAILGDEPSPWDATDILATLKLQSFMLPSNWDVELGRLRILLADGPEAVLALDPVSAAGSKWEASPEAVRAALGSLSSVSAYLSPALAALASDLSALQSVLPRGGGSNHWVISGSRTQSGRPILASDPHLAPSLPAPWYLSHIRTPGWEAVGASLTGSPGHAIGHNGFAAWGVTAGLTDNTDFFLETLGPDGKTVREADGRFTPCEVVQETIRVKGGADVVEEVVVTPRGPVLSPILQDVPVALSLRAVWLDPLPIDGFLGIPSARSFDEFRNHFARWPLLPLNIAYADTGGTTAWFLMGQLPRRRGGNGLLPRPADLPDSGWDGLVPFTEMPVRLNPPEGFWATANNDPTVPLKAAARTNEGSAEKRQVAPMFQPWLGADYCDPYRAQTIFEALGSREGWTVEDCLALQCDVRSIPWEEMRAVVLSLQPSDSDGREGLELLREWDGRIDSESPAACVFELFCAELCQRIARVKAPKSWPSVLGEVGLNPGNPSLFTDRRVRHLIRLINQQPEGWFPSWSAELVETLSAVVRNLRLTVGPGRAYWAWGHQRRLRLEHPLFGKHRWLGPAFNIGPVPYGGDCNTVSQAGARPANPTDFTHNMCNLRTVFDLGDLANSRYILCGGQSGNPLSDHFADQFPIWQRGEAVTLPWDQASVIRAAKQTMRLLPVEE